MKKNFTKIPIEFLEKVASLPQDQLIVSTAVNLKAADFQKPQFNRLGLQIEEGTLQVNSPVLPKKEAGKYSKRNIEGYFVVRKDLPKISKTYYLVERPVWGDWDKGSFSLWVTKTVFQREEYKPEEREILVELLEIVEQEGETTFTIKFSVNALLNRTSEHFLKQLLTYINLLQENVGQADLFAATATHEDFIETVSVNWDIFPPGTLNDDITRIISGQRNPGADVIKRVTERYEYLKQFNPTKIISGLNGMKRYFGMQFQSNFIVFENMYTGNAIYFLFDNWEENSKLTRSEIMKLPESKFLRIKHTKYWKERLAYEINSRLNNPPKTAAA
jgi:hypothetical protein